MLLNEKILILLSTYNGDKYLQKQLNSLLSQIYKNIEIIVRDDRSSDETLDVISSYDVKLMESQSNIGSQKSFSLLLEYVLYHHNSNYFMFCDQDDIWEAEKIEKTYHKMQKMERIYPNTPILVHTDLEVVDENLKRIDKSFWHFENMDPSQNSFNRLLMQNTITGCTVMINRKLAELCLPIPNDAIMHDWWIGLVASKFGKIAYIDEPLIKYRQHSGNSIGAKRFGYLSIFMKFYKIFFKNELYLKHMGVNIKQAKAFLEMHREKLDIQTIEMLKDFTNIESKPFLQRRKILLKYRLIKQGLSRNIGLLCKI
ncbi:MAG: glycosyltransferase family 2 protein [Campylobacteraceae bacterium]|nr:glycosyltransferase family 2 protein [Campylobacteraceae bacterium]